MDHIGATDGRPAAAGASRPATTAPGNCQAPEPLCAELWPVVWYHTYTYPASGLGASPLPDLRTALAATRVCRGWREELRSAVTMGRLERPSQALLSATSRAFPRLEELEVAEGPAENTRGALLGYTHFALPNPVASAPVRTEPAGSGELECQRQQQQQQQSREQPRALTAGALPFSEHRQGGGMGTSASSGAATHAGSARDEDHWPSNAWVPAAPQASAVEFLAGQWRPPLSLDFGSLVWPALRMLRLHGMATSAARLPAAALPRLEELYLEDGELCEVAWPSRPLRLETICLRRMGVASFGVLVELLDANPQVRTFRCAELRDPLFGLTSKTHLLRLPQCEDLLIECECVTHLRVWAPCLRRLDLGACRRLRSLRLLGMSPRPADGEERLFDMITGDMAALSLAPAPSPAAPAGGSSAHAQPAAAPSVWVDLRDTTVSRYTLKHLRTHPRVGPERLVPPVTCGGGASGAQGDHGRVQRSPSRSSRGSSLPLYDPYSDSDDYLYGDYCDVEIEDGDEDDYDEGWGGHPFEYDYNHHDSYYDSYDDDD